MACDCCESTTDPTNDKNETVFPLSEFLSGFTCNMVIFKIGNTEKLYRDAMKRFWVQNLSFFIVFTLSRYISDHLFIEAEH